MNAVIRNIISLVTAVAFFWLPAKKNLTASAIPESSKSVFKIEEIAKIQKDTPLYLMHADDLFGEGNNYARHASHSSHRSHASHSSHRSHYSSSSAPSTPTEPSRTIEPEKSPSLPKEKPAKTTPAPPQSKNQAESYFNLGASASQRGQHDEAIKHYNRVISIDPRYEHAHNNLGVAYLNKGDEKKAIESFEKAIAIDPSQGQPYYNLGAIYYNKGLVEKAREYFTKGCDLGQTDACNVMKNNY